MWRLPFLLCLFAGFPQLSLLSQKPAGNNYADKPLRVEIPARSVNETYRMIPCGTSGVILFFRSQEVTEDGRVNWYFTCYDTNLQQLWVKSVPLLSDQEYRFHQKGSDTATLMFFHAGKSKDPDNSYQILQVVVRNGTLVLNSGKLETGAVVEAFGVQNGFAWLGVNVKDGAGRIVNVNLKFGIHKAFSLGNGSQIAIRWMQPDTASYTVSAMVGRIVSKKSTEYYLVRYDTSGNIRREVLIGTQAGERTLPQVRLAGISQGDELLMGSYGQGIQGTGQKGRQTDESTGFFASRVLNGAQKSISFYNFLELQSAGSIVGESDIMNLKKKALKKKKSIAEYSLDYSVLMHDILVKSDGYILTAELFSPQYHTESFTDIDFYGRPYTNSYSVFDGYRFFNAVVAGFDTGGKLIWDNYIEIRNVVSPELSPKVTVYPLDSNLVLCYVSDGKIGSKIIRDSIVTEKLDFSPVDMLNPDDKLQSETKGALMHWYGNFFLSSGYQEIKNIALTSNNKRLVFYFSKLRFEK